MTSDSAGRIRRSTVLNDGRALRWHEYGDITGSPCLFLPGVGTSGRAGAILDAAAAAAGIRLISVDRPGLGHSDPAPVQWGLAGWTNDAEQLVDQLGFERFGVVGHSAGGAYALALARWLSDRVVLTVIGAGLGPFSEDWYRSKEVMSGMSRVYYRLALRAPRLFGALHLASTPRTPKAIDRTMALVVRGRSADARFARSHPEESRASLEALADGCRQGSRGPTNDVVTVCQPWSFTLTEISGPVDWWHGEQDANVNPLAGREITARLRDATAHFVTGGHYALFEHTEQIMSSIRRASDQSQTRDN